MKSSRASRQAARRRKLRQAPWWTILLGGIALVIIGVLLIAMPKTAATGLFLVLGGGCVIGGLGCMVSIAFERTQWVSRLLAGAGLIVLGLALSSQPLLSAYLVAADRPILPGRGDHHGRHRADPAGFLVCWLVVRTAGGVVHGPGRDADPGVNDRASEGALGVRHCGNRWGRRGNRFRIPDEAETAIPRVTLAPCGSTESILIPRREHDA